LHARLPGQRRRKQNENQPRYIVKTHQTGSSRLRSLIFWTAWPATLLVAASVGALWYVPVGRLSGEYRLFAASLGVLAVAGLLRSHFRWRATRRLQAVLDAYAERQIGRGRHRPQTAR